jgi:uncharacterized membrane protein
LKGKREKEGSTGKGNADGDRQETLTPRQMAALHWAKCDLKATAAKTRQAAVQKGQNEAVKGDQVAGGYEHGAEEANAGTDSAGPVVGKLRNGMKQDIGQRLGGNWRLRIGHASRRPRSLTTGP